MTSLPRIETGRLVLRAFTLEDAPRLQELAGDRRIAETTATVPHPYDLEMAREWIGSHRESLESGRSATFAITLRSTDELIGAIGLVFDPTHESAELGYWVGVPFWNRGYCTEAARAILDYGFVGRRLHRIEARHMTKNPASGRVMEKIGLRAEGICRQAMKRFGAFEDIALFGILAEDRKSGRS